MDFNLNPEQQMIQNTVRDIAQKVIAPRAAEVDKLLSFPKEGLKQLAEAGMMGMTLPPVFGGGGVDTLSFVLAAEEIARACASTALIFVTHVVASFGILVGGNDTAKGKYLPALAKGEKLAAFAATESESGANVLAIKTTAQADGDHYVINGSKVFITSGGEADTYLVVVRTSQAPGPAGLSMVVVDKDTPGFDFGKTDDKMGLNGISSRELVFDVCRTPKANLLGQEGGYIAVAMPMVALAMLGVSGIAVGIAQAAVDASVAHGKTRVVAGQPLGNYQGIQFLVSEMSAATDAARALLYWAACLRDNAAPGPPIPAFKAKLFATETAIEVTNKAIQVHGSHGYSRELPIERYFRDARGLTMHFSPSEALKETVGKMLMDLMPPM